MLTIQKGMRVTSTSLAGSQNPIGIPGTGVGSGGRGQKHGMVLGFSISSRPPALTFTGPIERGNKQDQQISVIGLTNRPGHDCVKAVVLKGITIKNHVRRYTCMQNHAFLHNNVPHFLTEDLSLESSDLLSFDFFFCISLLGWLLYRWGSQQQWSQLLEMLCVQLQKEHLILCSSPAEKKHTRKREQGWVFFPDIDFAEEEERSNFSLNSSKRPRRNADFLNT
jgi:hypothetical protein